MNSYKFLHKNRSTVGHAAAKVDTIALKPECFPGGGINCVAADVFESIQGRSFPEHQFSAPSNLLMSCSWTPCARSFVASLFSHRYFYMAGGAICFGEPVADLLN
jgi:hypothetical protein